MFEKCAARFQHLLFILVVIMPFGKLLTGCFGYTFSIFSVPVFTVVTAIIAFGAMVFSNATKDKTQRNGLNILIYLLTPLSVVNAFLCIMECKNPLVVISCVVCVLCCFALTAMGGEKMIVKIAVILLSGVMLIPVGFVGLFALIIGNFGQNTVVKTVESPNGIYYAEVINSDQGALGGDTIVNVRRDRTFNALFVTIEEKTKRVYLGEWGTYVDMDIYWKDDECLVINSKEYEVGLN